MTLKQKRTLKLLPKNNFNISKSMKEAGYTQATSVSGTQYKSLRRFTSKLDFFDPEQIKKDINQVRKLAKRKEDVTNLNRIDEHRAKIAGIIVEKQEKRNLNPDKLVIVYDKQKPQGK